MAGAEGTPKKLPWRSYLSYEGGDAVIEMPRELSGGNAVEFRNLLVSQAEDIRKRAISQHLGGRAIRLLFENHGEMDGDGLTGLFQAVTKAGQLGIAVRFEGVDASTLALFQETGVSRFFDISLQQPIETEANKAPRKAA